MFQELEVKMSAGISDRMMGKCLVNRWWIFFFLERCNDLSRGTYGGNEWSFIYRGGQYDYSGWGWLGASGV